MPGRARFEYFRRGGGGAGGGRPFAGDSDFACGVSSSGREEEPGVVEGVCWDGARGDEADDGGGSDREGEFGGGSLPGWMRAGSAMICCGVALFVGDQGLTLFREWSELREQRERLADTTPIGFVDISPVISFAQRPTTWHERSGAVARLWSGWDAASNNHVWFEFERGVIDDLRFGVYRNGSGEIRPIDQALLERSGGARWERMPDSTRVFGLELGDRSRAYPMKVLDKVELVNDRLGGAPVLIQFNPLSIHDGSVAVRAYATGNGTGGRWTFGVTGYRLGYEPVLFDRETLSLWTTRDGALEAFAGKARGERLAGLPHPEGTNWRDWSRRHPRGELVAGAIRDEAGPPRLDGRLTRYSPPEPITRLDVPRGEGIIGDEVSRRRGRGGDPGPGSGR